MATATSGPWTATMSFATQAQSDLHVRYQATQDAIRALKASLKVARVAGTITVEEYLDKKACLADLFAQSEALWDSQGPSVRWLQIEPIEEIPIVEITP